MIFFADPFDSILNNMAFFQKLLRIPTNRYIITAALIGVVGSSTCIGALKYSQYSILKRPFYTIAIEELSKNKAAIDIIGEFHVNPPDLVDKTKNKIGKNEVDFWVPFNGSKQNGNLRIIAKQVENNSSTEWILERMEMKLNNIPDKLVIVYKRKELNK